MFGVVVYVKFRQNTGLLSILINELLVVVMHIYCSLSWCYCCVSVLFLIACTNVFCLRVSGKLQGTSSFMLTRLCSFMLVYACLCLYTYLLLHVYFMLLDWLLFACLLVRALSHTPKTSLFHLRSMEHPYLLAVHVKAFSTDLVLVLVVIIVGCCHCCYCFLLSLLVVVIIVIVGT